MSSCRKCNVIRCKCNVENVLLFEFGYDIDIISNINNNQKKCSTSEENIVLTEDIPLILECPEHEEPNNECVRIESFDSWTEDDILSKEINRAKNQQSCS